MTEAHEVTGRCLCGSVRYSATVKNHDIGACHCGMCRRWTTGPFMALESVQSVRWDDETPIAIFHSSEWGERGFCRDCGTALFWRARDGSYTGISACTLDNSDGLNFSMEVFIDEKPEFYAFANETKKLTGKELFDMFMGGGEKKDA